MSRANSCRRARDVAPRPLFLSLGSTLSFAAPNTSTQKKFESRS